VTPEPERSRTYTCLDCGGLGFRAGAHTEQVNDCPKCDGWGVVTPKPEQSQSVKEIIDRYWKKRLHTNETASVGRLASDLADAQREIERLREIEEAAQFVAYKLGAQGGDLSDAESHLRHFLDRTQTEPSA
jgi:hypothetical protein